MADPWSTAVIQQPTYCGGMGQAEIADGASPGGSPDRAPRWLTWLSFVTRVVLVVAQIPMVLTVVGAAVGRDWAVLFAGVVMLMVSVAFLSIVWPSSNAVADDHT